MRKTYKNTYNKAWLTQNGNSCYCLKEGFGERIMVIFLSLNIFSLLIKMSQLFPIFLCFLKSLLNPGLYFGPSTGSKEKKVGLLESDSRLDSCHLTIDMVLTSRHFCAL